jgi:hypothetical protein
MKKIKFVRDAYAIGRHPSIKDGLGFQKGTKNLTSQRTSNLNKVKGKAPMASSSHSSHDKKNHTYLYTHVKNVFSVAHDRCYNHVVLPVCLDAAFDSHAMFESTRSFHDHGRSRPRHHHVASHVPRNASNGPTITLCPIPRPAVLTPGSSLGSYIVPIDQHESFVHTLSSVMRIQENFPVGHPSQIAPSQTRLTWRFFRARLPKKKMHLVGMDTLLILLSLGPGYHHPRGYDITIHPLRRLMSSSVNPNPGTFPLSHVYVSSVVICHVTTPGPHAPCAI